MLVEEVADWLMAEALGDTTIEILFQGCCDRLFAAGLPLLRVHTTYRTLHPLYNGTGMTWWRDRPLEIDHFARSDDSPPDRWLKSPYFFMIERRIPVLRRRLSGPEAQVDFPILEELCDQGTTDYLADLVAFGSGTDDGTIGSWTTDRATGFTEGEIAALLRIRKSLAVAIKMRTREEIARNVMTTYLGPVAGLRVLDGQIQRGDGETMRAAIWYYDLRGSTEMAERLSHDAYIDVLNQFFDSTGGAVLAAGGEILGFLGDAVLAIFPIGEGDASPEATCRRALDASKEAHERIDAINQTRGEEAPLSFGLVPPIMIAWHVGSHFPFPR